MQKKVVTKVVQSLYKSVLIIDKKNFMVSHEMMLLNFYHTVSILFQLNLYFVEYVDQIKHHECVQDQVLPFFYQHDQIKNKNTNKRVFLWLTRYFQIRRKFYLDIYIFSKLTSQMFLFHIELILRERSFMFQQRNLKK